MNNSPHLLSHFGVSFRSVDLTVSPGIESRSTIIWPRYLVPLPPPFAASDEIHGVCFRRWVRLGCRCLCTVLRFNTGPGVRRSGNGWRRCGILRYRRDFEKRRSVNSSIRTSASHSPARISPAYTRRG